MPGRTTAPQTPPLLDDPAVKDVYADTCAGLNVLNGNVHFTFSSIVADHTGEDLPAKRVVSSRVVMSLAGAVELRELLTTMIEKLGAQADEPAKTNVRPFPR